MRFGDIVKRTAAMLGAAITFYSLASGIGDALSFCARTVVSGALSFAADDSFEESAPTDNDTVELLRYDTPLSPDIMPPEVIEIIEEDASDVPIAPESAPLGENIEPRDLSRGAGAGELLLSSELKALPDLDVIMQAEYPIERAVPALAGEDVSAGEAPLVLIIHTHGTEGYTEAGEACDGTARNHDITSNVVSCGTVLAGTLREYGIPTLHSEEMFDRDSYERSYEASLAYVKACLREYPSIRYVFDLHRDALETSSGMIAKTSASPHGVECAQIMAVVGTNSQGADHPRWRDNLRVACELQYILTCRHPGIARPINLRGASFNQQYSTGFLLLEIGSSGNTPEEAQRASRCLGEAIADMILGFGEE